MKRALHLTLILGVVIFTCFALTPASTEAAVAASVQVVNTATAPAVSQDVSKLASQNVLFVSNPVPYPNSDSLHLLGKDSQYNPAAYTVPAGQVLIITSVDLVPNSAFSFSPAVVLKNPAIANSFYGLWIVTQGVSIQFLYPTGIAIQGGITPSLNISQPGFSGELVVLLHGYLTSN